MHPFRPATLEERKRFYEKEFDLDKVRQWFKDNRLPLPQLYAVDMGTESKIILNKAKLGKILSLKPQHLVEKLISHLPEDVYYDRNRYRDVDLVLKKLNFREIFSDKNFLGQQLAFDVDPENIPCSCKSKFPKFCTKCMRKAVQKAIALAEHISSRFKRVGFVYSGRGMHVHVFDRKAFSYSLIEREELNRELKKFGIDPWVSHGKIRLMRLPYSLHGLVSRKVLPLALDEVKRFNPLSDRRIIPEFLRD